MAFWSQQQRFVHNVSGEEWTSGGHGDTSPSLKVVRDLFELFSNSLLHVMGFLKESSL